MKLPRAHNKYQHNQQIEKLYALAYEINLKHSPLVHMHDICLDNLKLVKQINSIVIHLELALDEMIKPENL